jgi:hypothetical protein
MRNGSGVARVSWRGKPVSLSGDGFLLSVKFRGHSISSLSSIYFTVIKTMG